MIYTSPEYMLPGMSGDGGLGALARDIYLEAVDLGYPGIFYGLLYKEKQVQTIKTDNLNHFWQDVRFEKLPAPDELGMIKVDITNVTINTKSIAGIPIPVYLHPLSTKRTSLYLFEVDGGVYPNENNSNERLWNNVVLGFGQQQITKRLINLGLMDFPAFFHVNESAMIFCVLAYLDVRMASDSDTSQAYEKALQEVRQQVILTNHTLVPAAEASFSIGQCEDYIFPNLKSNVVKTKLSEFMDSHGGKLTLLDLANHLADKCNGVSEDHARLASGIFRHDFYAVTNGIYEKGWAPQILNLLIEYRVVDQFGLPRDNYQERIAEIPVTGLQNLKAQGIFSFKNYLAKGNQPDQFGNIVELPENVIIIGDARRYAGYKRRRMIITYPDVLENMLVKHQNVHLIISGKAHPYDLLPKDELSTVLNTIAGNKIFKNRIHFLPNWDTNFAQNLFPATHIWLNYPRVGFEACGTSGMKAGLNGALLLSTIDGFFAEMKKDTYYAVEGRSDTSEEYNHFYTMLEKVVSDAEDPNIWARKIKKLWMGDFLKIVSGVRMLSQYMQMALPK
jgi:alpha-glucan phosphorylase-like protein